VCKGAAFTLLSVGKCQSRGLGCNFPPVDANLDDLVCRLYTHTLDGVREDLQDIELDATMQLYLVDVNSLSDINHIEYVRQKGDYTGKDALLGGSLGTLSYSQFGLSCVGTAQDIDEDAPPVGKEAVVASLSKRKRHPSHDMCRRVWNLHENLGHAEMRNVAQQIVNGDAGEVDVEAKEIDLVIAHQHCLPCAIAKWKRYNVSPGSGIHENIVGRMWSMDYQGPFSVQAVGGYTGKFTCVDLCTGLGQVYLVKGKDEALSVVQRLSRYCKKWNHMFLVLKVDAGSVENAQKFQDECAVVNGEGNPGVDVRPAGVEQQNQNTVERHIQTIENQINAISVGTDTLPSRWWGWASFFAWKTRNHIRNKLCPDSTPIYRVEGKLTDFSTFRFKFGQTIITRRIGASKTYITRRNELGIVVCPILYNGTVMVYLPERGRDFVAPRADVRALMVGAKQPTMSIQDGQKYMPALLEDGSIGLITRGDTGFLSQKYIIEKEERQDVIAIEQGLTPEPESIHGNSAITSEYYHSSQFESSTALDDTIAQLQVLDEQEQLRESCQPVSDLLEGEQVSVGDVQHSVVADEIRPLDTRTKQNKLPTPPSMPPESVPEGRSRRPVANKPSRYANVVTAVHDVFNTAVCALLFLGACIILNMRSPNTNPIMSFTSMMPPDEYARRNPTWGEAMKGPDREQWIAADRAESDQHFLDQKTFQHVPGGRMAVPRGHKVLPLKRHCKIKDDGTFKVRWVALGNLDNFDGDTFAPTASKKVVWFIFAVALLLGLIFQWYDIKGAFMAEKPTRVVYVEIDNEVYILLKSLYGLTDAPKLFNDGLVAHLKSGGYVQSTWDQCLFVKWTSRTTYIYIVFHVDDFTGCATHQSLLDDLAAHLRAKYTEVKTNHDGMFLGVLCECQSDGYMKFTKPFQVLKIIDHYLPNGLALSAIPKDPMSKQYLDKFSEPSPSVDSSKFRSLLGALMQLNDVRADLVFPLAKIATKTEAPREIDYAALMHVVHYLYGTRDVGIRLRGGDSASATRLLKLRAYADCGFANHEDGKSTYCMCFDVVPAEECLDKFRPFELLRKTAMFYFKSKKATNVDLATAQGECGSVVEAVKDVILLRGVCVDLHQEQIEPTPVYNDNKSAITLSTQYSGAHKRVRYMLTRINWLMEKTKEKVYELLYLSSPELPADFGTKLHTGEKRKTGMDTVMGL